MAVSLPQAFVESTRAALGDKADAIVEAILAGESVTAVRANPLKISADVLRGRFASAGERVPWCEDAFYLNERPVFSLDPLIHAGAYYVQDPSAMFVWSLAEVLIRQSEASLKVLDLCAAPGGKSTAVASALRPSDLLVSNEVIGSRASVLAENMVKWGCSNTIVTNNDPKDFARLAASFDIILADVPCSGEGMFRKDPEALAQWSPENVKLCAARQRRIVADVWPALREGGWLLYSTCTFNSSENDGNVEWIGRELGAEVVPPSNAPSGGAVQTSCGLQLGMGLTRGEGQYVALLRKTAARKAGSQPKVGKPSRKVPCDWLESGVAAYEQSTSAGIMLKAYPEQTEAQLRFFESSLRAIRSGVAVAYVKGRDLVPQTDLALSRVFRREAFAQAELTRDQALQFLRCAALQLPDAPRGFNAVTYERLPLGFVKNLGNRANNLFPQAWRLRM